MPRKKDDAAYAWDILEAARLARTFVADMCEEDFEADPKTHAAVVRQLEIVGEATKRLSHEFREQHPHIPDMAGMRDILIHAYDHVDTVRVWRVATQSLPDLIAQIANIPLPAAPEPNGKAQP